MSECVDPSVSWIDVLRNCRRAFGSATRPSAWPRGYKRNWEEYNHRQWEKENAGRLGFGYRSQILIDKQVNLWLNEGELLVRPVLLISDMVMEPELIAVVIPVSDPNVSRIDDAWPWMRTAMRATKKALRCHHPDDPEFKVVLTSANAKWVSYV